VWEGIDWTYDLVGRSNLSLSLNMSIVCAAYFNLSGPSFEHANERFFFFFLSCFQAGRHAGSFSSVRSIQIGFWLALE
jgi:hypothetical protein